ncbi:MAG: hypothetical protein ABSA67_01775 [Candidatus Brocadiia bacterium]|jgi:hypothetical protein
MKRYGIAVALAACLVSSWTCGASEPSQPPAPLCPPTASEVISGTPASETAPFDPAFSASQDRAICRELNAISAATHPFENRLSPPENYSIPVDRGASPAIGVPIGLGKNWTVRPWINFALSTDGSQNGDTVKSLGKAMYGMSLSWSF